MKKFLLSLMILGLLAPVASADWAAAFTEMESVASGNNIYNNLDVMTGGQPWLSSQLYVTLDNGGELIQNPGGGTSFAWAPFFGEDDSYLIAGISAPLSAGELASRIDANDFTAVSMTMTADVIVDDPGPPEISHVPAWGSDSPDGLGPDAAHIVFSNVSQGDWVLKMSVKDSTPVFLVGTVDNGIMNLGVVPEPSTIALLLCGALGLLVFRRK